MKTTNSYSCVLLCAIIFSLGCTAKRYTDPLSPQTSIQTFQVAEGFTVEPFAVEPMVKTPVDMIFDEQGEVYVIEMQDYPYKAEAGKGKGVIRVLSDTDKDGRIDTSVVFADGLPSATSMLPWKNGLIVTAAPDILYLKDTTGDHKADIKEVLFTGFFADNSEAQITSLTFGVDNWIYANNHGQRGEVRFKRDTTTPARNVSGGDFRFRLDLGLFEKEAGSGQFGLAMDDWGHRFYTQNTLHIQQAPIRWRYLHRHGFLPSDNADLNISDHESVMFQKTPAPYWRAERSAQRQKDFDEAKLDRKEYADGHFTGASGGTFYGGDGFPENYYGSIFTGDVAGNLVHRDVIKPGTTTAGYIARRGEQEKEKEFIASTDPWFRPVNFYTGPDGYLYIVDMYRQHIETPVSIPEELKTDMDFSNGDQYGRIYRVLPNNAIKKEGVFPNLRTKTSAELVAFLSHPNQWWRQQAQRLLLERQDRSVIPLVKGIFSNHEDARARLHALYVLEGLDALDLTLVQQALKDPQPGIREQALILSERFPQLLTEMIQLIDDTSVQVAFQATLSIGVFSGPAVSKALASVIQKHISDKWFQKAVLSSNEGSWPALLTALVQQSVFATPGDERKRSFIEDIGYINGARGRKEEILRVLTTLTQNNSLILQEYRLAGLEGLKTGIEKIENKNVFDAEITNAVKNLGKTTDEAIRSSLKKIEVALGDTSSQLK